MPEIADVHLPWNPRPRRHIKPPAPASPCIAPPLGISPPKSAAVPCLEAPWVFLLAAPQSRGGKGEGVQERGNRQGAGGHRRPVRTGPCTPGSRRHSCRGRKSFDVCDHSRTGGAAERRGDWSCPLRSRTSRRHPCSATSTLVQAGPLHPPHQRLHIGQWPPR
jgi:hypothetical protein